MAGNRSRRKATMSVLDANVYGLSSRRAALPIGISPNCNCIVCGSFQMRFSLTDIACVC